MPISLNLSIALLLLSKHPKYKGQTTKGVSLNDSSTGASALGSAESSAAHGHAVSSS